MTELQSFKKYSWLISGLFAVIVFISSLTANDLSFLPTRYKTIAVGVIGACALIVKIIPENFRVTRAEDIIKAEQSQEAPHNVLQHYDDLGDDGV